LTDTSHNIVKFSADSTGKFVGELLNSNPLLAQREPHGIKYEKDEKDGGKEYLYHTNPGWEDWWPSPQSQHAGAEPAVVKTDLSGETILWRTVLDQKWALSHNYTAFNKTRLTDVIPLPGTDYILVTDGYGSSFVHVLNKTDGAYVPGMSFGGKPTFSCPHKITVDEVSKKIVICDRSHHRRVWLDYDLNLGNMIAQTIGQDDSSMAAPCQTHYRTDPIHGRMSAVASLTGSVAIYSEPSAGNATLLSTIPVRQLLGEQGHTDPHDILFLPSGDIVVTCWKNPSEPTSIGTISYWKRLV